MGFWKVVFNLFLGVITYILGFLLMFEGLMQCGLGRSPGSGTITFFIGLLITCVSLALRHVIHKDTFH